MHENELGGLSHRRRGVSVDRLAARASVPVPDRDGRSDHLLDRRSCSFDLVRSGPGQGQSLAL
jgi:hypothetical protein